MKKNNPKRTSLALTWGLAMGIGLIVTIALPLAIMIGVTGCAGDRYHQSTGEYIDDGGIKVRVSSALADNPDYKFSGVSVNVFKGTVELGGFVDMNAQKSAAADIARGVQGVRKVVNQITIKDKSQLAEGQSFDDKQLVSNVKDALGENPDYKFGDIKIAAANGTVQLSGFVNTTDQKMKAGDIAKQATGVKDVVNNIVVKDKMD